MSEIELPALPARLLRFQTEFRDGERLDYSANQMREYARAAVLAERERCAMLCENLHKLPRQHDGPTPTYKEQDVDCYDETADRCAAAIREGAA